MNIQFELQEDKVVLFGEAENMEDSLHEALCQLIYENSSKAKKWLQENVTDVVGE
jgi:hypothetical protein